MCKCDGYWHKPYGCSDMEPVKIVRVPRKLLGDVMNHLHGDRYSLTAQELYNELFRIYFGEEAANDRV